MSKNQGLHRLNKKMDAGEDWVHDKFRAESPGRKENAPGNRSRRGDYYNGDAMMRLTDSYKPDLANNSTSNNDTVHISTRPPMPRGRQDYLGDGRYSVDKPTVYRSLIETLVKNAHASGVTSKEIFDIYYRAGAKAKGEKPEGSAYWLLWRQECLIWKKLFPDRGFIGAEPKLKPTLPDTETRNFSVMDSSKLWRILEASPGYGRLRNDNDRVSSALNSPSNLTKQSSRTTLTPASTYGRLERLEYESQSSRTRGDSIRDGQIKFQPSQLIMAKACSRVPIEVIVTTYEEKLKLARDLFPNEKEEWQRWFVEATVRGQLFPKAPLPHSEPRYYHRPGDNGHIANSVLDGHFEPYINQEAVMERMAVQRGIRKEFYQYLNTIRHVAREVYPLCGCYARNFFADRLVWRKFFREPFPKPWPSHDHRASCNANIPTQPSSVQLPVVAPSKSSLTKVKEQESTTWPLGVKSSWAKQLGIKSEEGKAVSLPSGGAASVARVTAKDVNTAPVSRLSKAGLGAAPYKSLRVPPPHSAESQSSERVPISNARAQVVESQSTSSDSRSSPTRTQIQPSGLGDQENNIYFTSAQISLQPPQSKTSALPGTHVQATNTENSNKELLVPTAKVPYEVSVPLSIMTALAGVRSGNLIPAGAVVMQNMDSTICQNENVALMARYFLAESAASITSISNGLKCHLRYKQDWNGDLILWVEPFSLGDTVAFSGGHLFLKGWVQRNLSFGVVKPSFYWDEIKNHPGFKQAGMAPSPVHSEPPPIKPKRANDAPSARHEDDATDSTEKNNVALIIRGSYLENVPCHSTALKNLVYSFFIDNSKEKLEQRLRCELSLKDHTNKNGGSDLQLEVKRHVATDDNVLNKATRFMHTWALRAMKPALCKPSTFLISAEGLQILGGSAILASNDVGQYPHGRSEADSPYNASDLDLLLSEEAAKAEGSLRLVLDEVTGDVVALRELLRKTLHRASEKMLKSSVPTSPRFLTPNATEGEEDEEEEDKDDEVQVFGTDGQMKDMGGGRFVVIKGQKQGQAARFGTGKRKLQDDQDSGKRAEKKLRVAKEMEVVREEVYESAPETEKSADKSIFVSVTEVVMSEESGAAEVGALQLSITEDLKRVGGEESTVTFSENSPRGVDVAESEKGQRKAAEIEPENHAGEKVCI